MGHPRRTSTRCLGVSWTEAEIIGTLTGWFWPFVRIAALVGTAPVLGNRSVPPRIKLGLALLLTAAIVPSIPVNPALPAVEPFSAPGLYLTAQQVVIGLAMGLTLRLAFVVLEVGGQLVAQLMGLGFASLVDPRSGHNAPLVSQFYIIMASLVFISLDGHLVMIGTLASSFVSLPIGLDGLQREDLWNLVVSLQWMLSAAVTMALPAVVALLTVNLSFGIVTKTAPQLNIFAVGFPVSLLFGFVVMILTLPAILGQMPAIYSRAFAGLSRLVGP